MTEEIGTLKELNVKPGDVVSYYGEAEYIVAEGNKLTHPDGKTKPYSGWDTVCYFYIVSRASEVSADFPKLWKDMSPEEKGALLLADYEGRVIQRWEKGKWVNDPVAMNEKFAYRVKPEPVRETVAYYWRYDEGIKSVWGYSDTHRITFDLVDGKPDCNSIKMEEIK